MNSFKCKYNDKSGKYNATCYNIQTIKDKNNFYYDIANIYIREEDAVEIKSGWYRVDLNTIEPTEDNFKKN